MSAAAGDYVYFVKVDDASQKTEPCVSREQMDAYKRDVTKYLVKKGSFEHGST